MSATKSQIRSYVYGSYGRAFFIERKKRITLTVYVPKGAIDRTAYWLQRNKQIGLRIEVRAIRWWMRPLLFFRPVVWWVL